jgi:hypothetical protein
MKAKFLILGGVARCFADTARVAVALIPLILLASSVRADLEPDCAANPYGIDGQLSEQDLNALFWIAFPQTTGDMRGRFGSPACFNAVADYYQVEGTNHWIAVDYSGDSAVSWRAWELAR